MRIPARPSEPALNPSAGAGLTNEEGARYAPDMMVSAVHQGSLSLDEALDAKDREGQGAGEALEDDIRNLRTWQVDAAKRAKSAGFDIIYVHAGMGFEPPGPRARPRVPRYSPDEYDRLHSQPEFMRASETGH